MATPEMQERPGSGASTSLLPPYQNGKYGVWFALLSGTFGQDTMIIIPQRIPLIQVTPSGGQIKRSFWEETAFELS